MKLSKDKVIANFLKSIFDEPKSKINANKDFIIKTLRLLNDTLFWNTYEMYGWVRKLPSKKHKVFLSEDAPSRKRFIELQEQYQALKKIQKEIQSIPNLPLSEEADMRATIIKAMGLLGKQVDNEKYISRFKTERDLSPFYSTVESFCDLGKHDIYVLHDIIADMLFRNKPPMGIHPKKPSLLPTYENLQKYKCKLITDDGPKAVFIKVYPNAKKENIKDFIDSVYPEIEDFFHKSPEIKRSLKDQGLTDLDQYHDIEVIKESENFSRDLQIYMLALQGLNDIAIQNEIVDEIDLGLIRKIPSNMKKIIESNYWGIIDRSNRDPNKKYI